MTWPVSLSLTSRDNLKGQAPSQNLGPIALDGLFKNTFERFVIASFLEEGHAGIAAIELATCAK